MMFSVIIPTYNRAAVVLDAVSSALSQEGDFEVIVVDDGSTDDTAARIQSISDKRLVYFSQQNGERGAARNAGAAKASGDYLIFLDSDDRLVPGSLGRVSDAITKAGLSPAWLFGGFRVVRGNGAVIYSRGFSGHFDRKRLYFGNDLGCSAVIVRKDIFMQYRFHEDRRMAGFEDWELWLRIAKKHALLCVPGIMVEMRDHDERSVLTASAEAMRLKVDTLRGRVLGEVLTDPADRRHRRTFDGGVYSYAALHLSMSGHRGAALGFLMKALGRAPSLIFRKRFYAIVRRLLWM